jgi:hypothetical protein
LAPMPCSLRRHLLDARGIYASWHKACILAESKPQHGGNIAQGASDGTEESGQSTSPGGGASSGSSG